MKIVLLSSFNVAFVLLLSRRQFRQSLTIADVLLTFVLRTFYPALPFVYQMHDLLQKRGFVRREVDAVKSRGEGRMDGATKDEAEVSPIRESSKTDEDRHDELTAEQLQVCSKTSHLGEG